MYTRNLRTVNADITEKDLAKLKCKFRNIFSTQVILGVVKKDYYEVMKRDTWLKGKNLLILRKWILRLENLETCFSYAGRTNYRNPDIIYDIVHVNFVRLRELYLDNNMITSLEPLMGMRIPKLKKLFMRFNLLINIDCLKRCHFPQLQQLNLSDNFILCCSCIADCYFPNLVRLSIEEKYQPFIYMQNVQGVGARQLQNTSSVNDYDMRWIMKLETPTMEQIKYSADERIIRQELEQQIGMKYYKVRQERKQMNLGYMLPFMSY